MKEELRKYKNDGFIRKAGLFTARALVITACCATIVITFLIIGTIFGELIWLIIPNRQ